MTNRPIRLLLGFAGVTAALMVAAPGALAHQIVTIEPGPGGTKTLHIVGDVTKETDEITVTYDSVADEYVIGHDIEEPIPADCYRDLLEPFHKLHCPAKGITHILIETNGGNDSVKTENIRLTTILNFVKSTIALFFPPDLIGMEIKAGPGNDKVTDTPVSQPADAGARHEANLVVEMEGGKDSASVPGGGENTFEFGDGTTVLESGDGNNTVRVGNGNARVVLGSGTNLVTVLDGNSLVIVGDGANSITLGDGSSKVTVGDGGNAVTFGDGNSVFTGGDGADSAVFGEGNGIFVGGPGDDTASFLLGNNTFTGGPGIDRASMGPGRDTATGGPAHDILRGGPGRDTMRGGPSPDSLFGGPSNDTLFGGPALDRLNGGPGGADQCYGGPAHAILRFCERP